MFLSLLTCRETIARLDDYLDRELSPREQTLVQRHLKICHHCTQIFRFEADLLDHMRQKLQRIEMPSDLKERILSSLPPEPQHTEKADL